MKILILFFSATIERNSESFYVFRLLWSCWRLQRRRRFRQRRSSTEFRKHGRLLEYRLWRRPKFWPCRQPWSRPGNVICRGKRVWPTQFVVHFAFLSLATFIGNNSFLSHHPWLRTFQHSAQLSIKQVNLEWNKHGCGVLSKWIVDLTTVLIEQNNNQSWNKL